MDVTRNNPLWLVFMVTAIILGYLNMRISVDTEEMKVKVEKKQTPYYHKVFLALAIGAIIFLIMALSGSPIVDSVITGIVLFVSFIIVYSVTHYLRKKRYDDNE